jgi:hypothetical protein
MNKPLRFTLQTYKVWAAPLWVVVALALSATACSSKTGASPAATQTPTATPLIASMASGSTAADSGEDSGSGESALPEEPEAPPVSSLAACLPGTWVVDSASLAGHIEQVMNTSSSVPIEIEASEGALLLRFDTNGNTSYSAQDLIIQVAISGLGNVSVVVAGEGTARYAADEALLATWEHELMSDAQGKGSVAGLPSSEAAAVLVLTPEQLFLQGKSNNLTITISGVPSDPNLTPYSCSGDILTLNPGDPRSTIWLRQP